MNKTPRGNRPHIAFFGRRNVGKSSLINKITNQKLAIVSEIAGTTTDPVYKSMEVMPIGPVVFIDTPGIDDQGSLGKLRIEKTREVLRKTDIGILVITPDTSWSRQEDELAQELRKRGIPFVIVINKSEDFDDSTPLLDGLDIKNIRLVKTSAETGKGVEDLVSELARLSKKRDSRLHLVDGLVKSGDMVVMVTPIDKGAPKGRLILPQQQVLRDILDSGAMTMVVKETELEQALAKLSHPPDVVITDSKVFDKVNSIVPKYIALTSFSIIYARHKGNLDLFYKAALELDKLEDGDNILVAEGCTHHREDDDIGTVKIPRLLKEKTGKELVFHHASGGFFNEDLSQFKMVIHCGACMLNKKEMEYRQMFSVESGVPMINYGIILAYLFGILDRAREPFQDKLNSNKKGGLNR